MSVKTLFLIPLLTLFLFQNAWSKQDFYKNVRSGRHGEFYIYGVPQVNQKRNYCVPASASMVIKYLNGRYSQKKLAGVFDTSKKDGTSVAALVEAFKAGKIEEFSLSVLYSITSEEQTALVDAYNSQNKSSRKKNRNRESKRENHSVFDTMNAEIARKIFPEERRELAGKMGSDVLRWIDGGIPLLWAVTLNFDPAIRMKGNHMRVIVGYICHNKKITHLLYRDPSGSSTRYKQVRFSDAVTMTLGVYAITPENFKLSVNNKAASDRRVKNKMR